MMTDSRMNTAEEIIGVSDGDIARIRAAIRDLPDTVPPRAVWERIEELGYAEGLLNNPRGWHPARWIAGAAVAATVAMIAINIPGPLGTSERSEAFNTVPDYVAQTQNLVTPTLQTLMVQSQQLERNLRDVPNQPRVMRASTAATMVQIEDRIALIDYQLNYPGSEMTAEQHRFYWQERVRLMNVLLQLRYAQARKASF